MNIVSCTEAWTAKHHPNMPFERFADDILCHCGSEQQVRDLKEALGLKGL
jgi:RNA-directed DNA polymerase